jgi:thiol-disulfide isomerase/thioredoxin
LYSLICRCLFFIKFSFNIKKTKKKKKKIENMLVALFLVVLVALCNAEGSDRGFNPNIAWTNSLENGLALAKSENKPAFVLIHKTWCGACKRLKSTFEAAEIEHRSKDFVMINLEDNEEPTGELYKPGEQGRIAERLVLMVSSYTDGSYIPRILCVKEIIFALLLF